jgi:hypothetical protein
MRYLELPREVPTGFNDRVLALLGNMYPDQVPVADVPTSILYLVPAAGIRVPIAAAMDNVVAAWDGPAFLGPCERQSEQRSHNASPCWFIAEKSRLPWTSNMAYSNVWKTTSTRKPAWSLA